MRNYAQGTMTIARSASSLSICLKKWFELAYRGSSRFFMPNLQKCTLKEWGEMVRKLALKDEGDFRPITTVGGSSLAWEGVFTQGREMSFDFSEKEITISWDSGTGERSSFLDIEGLEKSLRQTGEKVRADFTPRHGFIALLKCPRTCKKVRSDKWFAHPVRAKYVEGLEVAGFAPATLFEHRCATNTFS